VDRASPQRERQTEYRALGTFASFDEAVKAANEWANAIDAGVSSKGMTVKAACEHYVKHLGLHKGASSKADAEGRFRRLVYDAKIGTIDISKPLVGDQGMAFRAD
jgi:hypothetical protein